MPGLKPKLAVTTPVTVSFPPEISAMSATSTTSRSPVSAKSFAGIPRSAGALDTDCARTPISPPTAYAEFLRFVSLNSPMNPNKSTTFSFSPTSAPSSTPSSGAVTPDSAPSTAASDCSCKKSEVCRHIKKEPQDEKPIAKTASRKRRQPDPLPPSTSTKSAPLVPPSPFDRPLLSAPVSGTIPSFPSLHIPPSPALFLDSPLTGTTAASSTRSPYSSRSTKSVFDWEAALKARRSGEGNTKTPVTSTPITAIPTPTTATGKGPSRTSIRHIREVVTRTVIYTPKNTPKMEPAPKGKRRKVE